jgi:hypothetical protein
VTLRRLDGAITAQTVSGDVETLGTDRLAALRHGLR